MADNNEYINFQDLERELHAALEGDERYSRENDAKFRAIHQKVATYDEFRDIVKASHLKPLDKGEHVAVNNNKKRGIWNSIAKQRHQDSTKDQSMNLEINPLLAQDSSKLPRTLTEFQSTWRIKDIAERLDLLRKMGPSVLGHLFRVEIPSGLLGDLLHTLLAFTPSVQDILLVVGILEALSEAKRFTLSLQFLSRLEKCTSAQLMDKLAASLTGREQDLAEGGVTEWTLSQLSTKYKGT